jgi:hypothetical protein
MAAEASYDVETGTLVLDRDQLTALGRVGGPTASDADVRVLRRVSTSP